MSVVLLVVGILLFIGLVVVHEFGHFILARRNGVEVEEFGIFFPPRLYKRTTKAGWVFSINALPLGGFVKLKGEHDTDTEPGSFGAASLWAKTKIMAAGVVMNLLTALVLFTALAWIGMPKLVCDQYTVASDTKISYDSRQVVAEEVEKGSPAARAGLQANDQLVAIGTDAAHMQSLTKSCLTLTDFTPEHAGQTVVLSYKHAGHMYQKTVALRTTNEVKASQNTKSPKGYLGVFPAQSGYSLQRSTWSAPVTAVGVSVQYTKLTFEGLGKAFAGLGSLIAGVTTNNTAARQHGQTEASSQVGGPLAIFIILKDGSALGWSYMLMIIAIISLTLAIMNILPIPALDGGRLWITLIARALKRPLNARTEEIVNATGFFVLISLVILITIVDVNRFF